MIQEVVEQMENMVKDVLNNSVHTAMPGKILSYDDGSGLADVQPVGSFYCGKVEMDYPVIPSIPICIMATSDGIASCIPIKAGDSCLLVCAEQSLSAFLTETSEAQSNERFELTNCIAIPGLMRAPVEAQQEANEKEALVMVNGETKIIVTEEETSVMIGGETKIVVTQEAIEITSDSKIEGNIEITGDVSIEGETTFSGKVSIDGDLFVDGNIKATGSIEGANTEG